MYSNKLYVLYILINYDNIDYDVFNNIILLQPKDFCRFIGLPLVVHKVINYVIISPSTDKQPSLLPKIKNVGY